MDSCKDTPYTFFQYVFVNDTAYQKKQLDPRLLHHELVHAKQWHSIDILLVELLKAIFWFNPIFHLYKKAIQLNHEFLADESVNRQFGNINAYQNLLLSYAGQQQQNKLVSYSKHSLTKTRLIMMRKEKNLSNILLKLALIIPFILGGTFLFSMKPQRTTAPKAIPQKVTPHPPSAPPQGDYLEEYKQHYQHLQELMDKKGKVNLNEIDIDRMRQLWDFMSDKQKEKAPKVHGVPAPPIPEKKHASNYQMEEWTTNHDYGIWLDDTLVPNEELSGFSSKDIAYWQYSRLYKNAKNYDKYKTRVSLMTHDGFYKTFIMKETGFDQLTAYNKAIEIYTAHQKHPKKNAGQLGGKLSDLQQVYNHIPQWKKEKYEVKPPSEIIKNL
nr:M56 family metallopeptidase [Echinicola vietnamensis]